MYVALTAAAHAQGVHPGPQGAPPVADVEPVLDQQPDGRRAIRGCFVGEACNRGGDTLEEIDVELFGRAGGNPWLDERTVPGSTLEAAAPRQVKRPSELRPDAPWLDQLELPDLPVQWSQRLVDYLVFYKSDPRGRSIIAAWLRDQGRYRDMISAYLRKAKLPQDLMYVAMIESSYDPHTLSSAGALGLWQFMPEGGRIYGLRQDRWVDDRRDPLRSTIAVLDYFRDLHQRFGDWPIALAAFNVGYGAMLKSIARYNTNDYYQLCEYENAVPWETCLYTPKVLATAIVGHNRALFGVDKIDVRAPERFDEIAVPGSIPTGILARAANTTEAEIQRLNPHLRRGRTPPGEVGYVVRVPAGTRADTQRRLAELQTDWDGYDAYVVAHGERFEDVATTYGLSTYALRRLNAVEHESEIGGGAVLVVPRISAEQRAKNVAKAKAKLLASGVDHKEGEQLLVPVPDKDAVIAGKRRVFYRVVTGDSLTTVAAAIGASRDQLATWNGLDEQANLHPRMVLVAWVAPDFDEGKRRVALLDEADLVIVTRGSAEHLDLAEARTGRVRIEYVAKGKEPLEDVARKYGMGSHDLARINHISYNKVLARGDKVIVYQVVDPSRSDRAEEQWKKTPKARRGKKGLPKVSTRDEDDDADAGEQPVAKAADRDADAAKPGLEREDARREAREDAKREAREDAKSGDTKREAREGAKREDAKREAREDAKREAREDAKREDAKREDAKREDAKREAPRETRTDGDARDATADAPRREAAPKDVADAPVTRPTQVE